MNALYHTAPQGFEPYKPMTIMAPASVMLLGVIVATVLITFLTDMLSEPKDRKKHVIIALSLSMVIGTAFLISPVSGMQIQDRPLTFQDRKERTAQWIEERYDVAVTPEELPLFIDEFYITDIQDIAELQKVGSNQAILMNPVTGEEFPRHLTPQQIAGILGYNIHDNPVGVPQEKP